LLKCIGRFSVQARKRIGVRALGTQSDFSSRFSMRSAPPRRQRLLMSLLSLIALVAGPVPSESIAAKASSDCGPVSDTIVASPDGAKIAHLMSQYCSYGFGAVYDPFWVVFGNEVAKAGQEDRVNQFGPEDHVVFKSLTFAPAVSWADENTLVITVEEISIIQKVCTRSMMCGSNTRLLKNSPGKSILPTCETGSHSGCLIVISSSTRFFKNGRQKMPSE
jgi:hypothetical protein